MGLDLLVEIFVEALSSGEEEALPAAKLKHAVVLLAELSGLRRLRVLLAIVSAVAAGSSIEVLEDLVAQIAGAGADDLTAVLGRLEYRTTLVRQLLRVGGPATFTGHLTDNAAGFFKDTLVIENGASFTAGSLTVMLFIVEGVVLTAHESRVQQIVVLVLLGSGLFLEELLHVFGDRRRHILESMTSLILGCSEEASVLIEVSVDLLYFGHFPTLHGRRAKTAIS